MSDWKGKDIWNVREEVVVFSQQMEKKLRDNDYKGGWGYCRKSFLLAKLTEEVAEVAACLDVGAGDLVGECADVANIAMMIADNWGATTPPEEDDADKS